MSSERTSDLAHELRTPITAILGYTNLLVEGFSGPPENLEKLLVIRNHSEYLLRLVNHLLTQQQATLPPRKLPIDPLEVACDVVSLLQTVAAEKMIALSVVPIGPLPMSIATDEMRLRQVLINLLGNALKFTNEGYVRVGLEVQTMPHPALLITVADSGIGMDQEQIAHLFQPFIQVHVSSRTRGGIGLGLSTSKRLMRQLGGELSVTSQPGQGSTFTVRLPVPAFVPADLVERSVPRPAGGALLGREVLLAALGKDQLLMVSAVLKRQDASLSLASDIDSVVSKTLGSIRAHRPFCAILLDDTLLQRNEAARTLRAHGYDGHIIALGDEDETRHPALLSAGIDEILNKPVEIDRLIAAIGAATRHSERSP